MSQPALPTDTAKFILSFYVPVVNTQEVCSVVCQKSGAGSYPGGLYTEVYWTTKGSGQFRPMNGSSPAIGSIGKVEKLEEDKVEMLCVGKDSMESAVKALQEVHPYEQVAYYVTRAEST